MMGCTANLDYFDCVTDTEVLKFISGINQPIPIRLITRFLFTCGYSYSTIHCKFMLDFL